MARFGIYFDYKMANRHAWLYGALIVVIGLILLTATCHNTLEYYMDSYSLLNLTKFITSSLHQNQMLGAPLLTYIYLMRNLRKRYATLNQLLRYSIYSLKSVVQILTFF